FVATGSSGNKVADSLSARLLCSCIIGQPEFSNLKFHTCMQFERVHPVVVNICAVKRPSVYNFKPACMTFECRVLTGNRDVVQEDVCIRMPSNRDFVLIEQKTSASIRTFMRNK